MCDLRRLPAVLTIAGSDSSGGSGIQADLKVFKHIGVYGISAITVITAQNISSIKAKQNVQASILYQQIHCLIQDFDIKAIKIGMLGSPKHASIIHQLLSNYQIIIDPVMYSSGNNVLTTPNTMRAIKKWLIPHALIITPNIQEAEILSGMHINNLHDMGKASMNLYEMGPHNVLIKGGHFKQKHSTDVWYDGINIRHLQARRINNTRTYIRGTGCRLSAAIVAYIALDYSVKDAIQKAKKYITHFIGQDIQDALLIEENRRS